MVEAKVRAAAAMMMVTAVGAVEVVVVGMEMRTVERAQEGKYMGLAVRMPLAAAAVAGLAYSLA